MKISCRKHYVQDGIRDDNCRGMQLLGDALERVRSQLQLDKVRVVGAIQAAPRRHVAWCREFADNHGDLIAGIAPGAVYTVL